VCSRWLPGGTLANSSITIASNGVLNVQGTVGTVNAGGTAGILSGNGSAGAVTLNSGGVINPGNGGAGSTLTLSSLIINGGSSYSWNLNGATNDLVNVTGVATFNATTNSLFTIRCDIKRNHQLESPGTRILRS
jgi:fibronectin-binding autotransporter adhesin